MRLTIDGYFFTCKSCGKTHFYSKYSKKPRRGVRLPCVYNKNAISTYCKNDFKKYWYGYYGEISDIIVREDYLRSRKIN